MKMRPCTLLLVCIFGLPGVAAVVSANRPASTSVKKQPPAPASSRKPATDIHANTAPVRPKETVRKAVPPARVTAHRTPAFNGRCEPSVRNRRFYRAAGVVCWEGRIYSTDNGGIPPYMLDYFAQDRRNVQPGDDAMNSNADIRPGDLHSSLPATPALYGRATVAPGDTVPTVPVSPEVFASLDVGMARSAVLEKLGKPACSITIPGDDGFVEIWTYQLTNGSTAKLNMEKGIISTLDPKKGGTAAITQ